MGNEIYQALWEYQAADINLSRFERKLRESQTRKKLLAMRNYLLEQQKKVKQLEEDLLKGQDVYKRQLLGRHDGLSVEKGLRFGGDRGFGAVYRPGRQEIRLFQGSGDLSHY